MAVKIHAKSRINAVWGMGKRKVNRKLSASCFLSQMGIFFSNNVMLSARLLMLYQEVKWKCGILWSKFPHCITVTETSVENDFELILSENMCFSRWPRGCIMKPENRKLAGAPSTTDFSSPIKVQLFDFACTESMHLFLTFQTRGGFMRICEIIIKASINIGIWSTSSMSVCNA